jgi:mannose-6-phosphate isomerase-like protein (cupin superfamily)
MTMPPATGPKSFGADAAAADPATPPGPRDSYVVAHRDELERSGDWTLVRRSLDGRAFGVNLVDIAPGGSIPEHDETSRDQEELFFAVSGSPALVIDDHEHPFPTGTFARVDPRHRRTVRNRGHEPACVLIVSAPRTSGYVPMDWA